MKFKSILPALVLPALFLQAAESLTFTTDNKLTGWRCYDRRRIQLDDGIAPGSKAIRLNNGNKMTRLVKLEPNTHYEFTYYLKGKDIQTGDKYGARIMINGGKKWARFTANPKNKWETGTFDWKKGSGIIDTARFGTGDITFYLALDGTGTAWFDGLQLKKLDPVKQKDAAPKTSYNIQLFPVNLAYDRFSICENLPGALEIIPSGKPKSKGIAAMVLELPDWLNLIGVCENLAVRRQGKAERLPSIVKSEKITRDGMSYMRHKITFDKYFLQWFGLSWYRLFVYLDAKKGSAGKDGRVFWSFDIGGEKYPVQMFTVKVLDPVKPQKNPCREFALWMTKISIHQTPFGRKDNRNFKFWTSLAQKKYIVRGAYRDMGIPYPGYETCLLGGGNLFSTHWDVLAKEIKEFRSNPKIPKDTNDKGKVSHQNSTTWYLLDDPDGLYDRYMRTVLRKLKELYPTAGNLVWDFEPHPFGYDEGGRARFAKKMKLDHVPTVDEINKKYYRKFFDYMVKLHAGLIAKTARIVHEEMSGVKFWLCSDNLHAAEPHIARWCGVDVSLSDDVVDVHNHMQYYAGTRYYDDMAYNIGKLKKPYLPLIDPAERSQSFFRQYSAPKIMQNIVATAALGGTGMGFWPDDILSGDYMTAIAEGFGKVAEGEDFYFQGKRCDGDFTVTPRNAISRKLAGGKEITFPDFSRTIRYTAHEKNGKYLITLFNYDTEKDLVAEVSGRNFGPVLVKVPREGCVLTGTGKIQDQTVLKREIAAFSGSSEMFRDHTAGNARVFWAASAEGMPVLVISDGRLSAGIDILNTSHAVSLKTADNTEMMTDGFAGRLMFDDPLQPKPLFHYISHGITTEGVPFVVSRTEIAPYEGANPIPNPLYQLKIERKFEIRAGKLVISHRFANPTEKAMPLKGRFNNFTWPGHRFDADKVTLNGKSFDKEQIFNKPEWDGGKVKLQAGNGVLNESLVFEPDAKFTGFYSWVMNGKTPRMTVEFLIDHSLKPHETIEYRYFIVPEK